MRPISLLLAAGLLAIAACEPAPPIEDPPEFNEAFPNLPLPAGGEIVSRRGSRDALQLVIEAPAPQAELAEMYRTSLTREPWRLVSDTRDSSGTIVLYAEGKSPLWVRISAASAGQTRVELNGAVPGRDTAYVRQRQTSSDTINTLRSRPPGAAPAP